MTPAAFLEEANRRFLAGSAMGPAPTVTTALARLPRYGKRGLELCQAYARASKGSAK